MNIPMFFEKRAQRRRKLTGLLPGRLIVNESGRDLDCRLVDINAQGLGVITGDLLPPGTALTLRTKEGDVNLEVSWGQPDFGKRDLFRYGLRLVGGSEDLEELFISAGCFK